jgi:Putative Ig domain
VGTLYSFQPKVLPNTVGVTFVITQKPAWASFNASTGALTGTPSSGNVGTTANIKITASDGSSSASIGPFEIAVDAPAPPPTPTGTATLTWVAPTDNTDGTPLVTLAGYHIYYGTQADNLTQEIDVPDSASTSYVINGLASGTYFFAVTAYSESGTESADSNVASKTI